LDLPNLGERESREIHCEQLAKLEAERGERFWVLDAEAAAV